MPETCEAVTLTDVIKFFVLDIDGMGILDGHLRNLPLPGYLELCTEWKLCELTEDEFLRLIIPDQPQILLRNKTIESVEGEDSIGVMQNYVEKLERGDVLPPLIVRNILPHDLQTASYYIEDGAHKSLGYKIYFESHPYVPVKAYIGKR